MSSNEDRRKSLRGQMQARLTFNPLKHFTDYMHGQSSIMRQLIDIEETPLPEPNTAANQYLQRINLKLTLLISILAEKVTAKTYLYEGCLQDISEFGLSFRTSQELPLGAYLEIGLALSGYSNRLLDLCGRIVRLAPPAAEADDYFYGLEFIDIQDNDRDEIVQWIFKKQRNDIRKRRESI